MKIALLITILTTVLGTALSFADTPKTLYGYDDRHEALSYFDPVFVAASQSVGALTYSNKLQSTGINPLYFDFENILAIRAYNLCPSERFGYQPVLSRCSAFLIADDIMMTAGHCITNQTECDNQVVVFDFHLGRNHIPRQNVFKCTKLLEQKLEDKLFHKYDYAIFKIDRATNRLPLTIELDSKPKKGSDVLTIGHPLGLPMKTTDGAKIKKVTGSYFLSNLDTYGGNSGSPVFDQTTGKVLGLVSFGQEDWINSTDPATGFACRRSVFHDDNFEKSERIFRIAKIKTIKKYLHNL